MLPPDRTLIAGVKEALYISVTFSPNPAIQRRDQEGFAVLWSSPLFIMSDHILYSFSNEPVT